MGFLEDIAVYLASAGVGVYPGTGNPSNRTIYVAELPDVPDAVIALDGNPGKPKDPKTDLQYPGLHIEVRASTYSAAQTKAEAIDAALHGMHDMTLNGHKFVLIQALDVPRKLYIDGRGRTIFFQNFDIIKGA